MKKNERSVQLHVTQYEKMIADLRASLATANEKVRNLEAARIPTGSQVSAIVLDEPCVDLVPHCSKCSGEAQEEENPTTKPLDGISFDELKKVRDAWNALCHDKREVQHKLATLEQLEKEFEQKIALKHQKNDRVESISLSSLRYTFLSIHYGLFFFYFNVFFFKFRLEKLRVKLEREISAQKPKLEIVKQKKEELSNRLASSATKESELNKNIEEMLVNITKDTNETVKEDFKQIVHDAVRMKQLEVGVTF